MMVPMWNRHPGTIVFLVSFALALVVQGSAWMTRSFPDVMEWASAAARFSQADYLVPSDTLYGYPGDTLFHAATPFLHAGLSPEVSLRMAMALLVPLSIALIALAAYRIFPGSPWWAAGAFLLSFDATPLEGVPPSSLAALILTLLFLLILLLEKERPRLPLLFSVGLVGGAALATRLDISLLVFGSALLYMRFARKIPFWIPGFTAVLVFLALDPSVWQQGLGYFSDILVKIEAHAAGVQGSTSTPLSVLSHFPYAFAGILLASILLKHKKVAEPLTERYLYWLSFTALGIVFLLLTVTARHSPIWFFFPALFVWELLFPLLAYRVLSDDELMSNVRPFIRKNALPFLAGAYLTAHVAAFTLYLSLG
jgi:hypothetical protein